MPPLATTEQIHMLFLSEECPFVVFKGNQQESHYFFFFFLGGGQKKTKHIHMSA